jgi:hypothetical protein
MWNLESLADCLHELAIEAEYVWTAYRESGPGSLDSSLLEPVEIAYRKVEAHLTRSVTAAESADMPSRRPQIAEAVATVYDLACRCVQRPEGLCFVSGEAGLIPRQDLHSKFEQSLRLIRDY